MLRLFALPTLFLLIIHSAAAQTSSLRGVVLHSESGVPVPHAHILLQPKTPGSGTPQSQSADEQGVFHIRNIAATGWTLRVTRAGYRPQTIDVQVPADEERNVIMYLTEVPYETRPIIVTGTHRHSGPGHDEELGSVLRGKELDRELGLSLAATLKNEVGIAMRSMGPAPARPVVRGLGGDRVFLAEDGIKTVDLSSTSPDHAVTIEPFGAERIEVLRGPRILTKSPVTIGGMVNVVRHDIPIDMHQDVIGSFGLYGETANRGYLASLGTEAPAGPLLLRGDISRRETGDVRTPVGNLGNSYSRTLNFALGGSMIREQGMIGVAQRHYTLSYGVPGGFVGAHPRGVNIEMERRQSSAKGSLNMHSDFLHDIQLTAARTYYRHKEFEASGLIGSEFLIVDWQAGMTLNHHAIGIVDEGLIGVSASHRDVTFGGFVFTVPAVSWSLAPYVYERFHLGAFNLEAALRLNHDVISPVTEKKDTRIGHIRERSFTTWSASVSALYPLTDIVRVGANVSRSSRVPTIEELYSEGPHLAAYSYEVGNPDLGEEHGIGTELFVTHKYDGFSWTLTTFRNLLTSYIIPRNSGEINYSTFLPIYRTVGVEALLYGLEGQLAWAISEQVLFDLSVAYTQGSIGDDGDPLPQIPPLKARGALSWRSGSWQLGLSMDAAAAQHRVDTFEEATAGYTVVNAFVQYTRITGGWIHNLSLNGDNLFDREYRNHLSRVKSILPEAGINVRATYKLHFSWM